MVGAGPYSWAMSYDSYGQMPVQPSFFLSANGQEFGPYPLQALSGMAQAGTLRADAMVRDVNGGNYFAAGQIPGLFSQREWVITLVLSIVVGSLGVDRFYLGQIGLGILKLITGGGFGVWWIIDVILLAMRKLPDAEGRPLR